MEFTTDVKIGLGVLIATIAIIAGGVFISSRSSETSQADNQPVNNPDRILDETQQSVGPEDAKVTVTEFGDFECPTCGAVYPILKQLKADNQDKSVRFVYRHFPLTQIHEHAMLAAEASEAAGAQGKFWEYHDKLFENQTNLKRADLERYAEEIGLNMDEFRKALDDHTYQDIVEIGIADGRALNIPGTPTIFINNTPYTGSYSVENIQSAIDAQQN